MARMVHCKKFNEELEGLDAPPFPGPKGQDIFENVSKKAWSEWLEHQTRLINEKHLNMMDLTARTYLNEQRDRFLSGQEIDEAEGFVPPSE
ncbi:oxidative damage protection protein [Porticoccus litoralis]|jgi:Fe-S cluster biosynthesis and repair protein YggX|uniref:Probable Fe(2+)-trafficking protein n=1 Tax=Porticoccus litoralis TaxID=434086 RepID=A0AAW8B0W7_9GAMM|nr:oxidative damage protection protein [Porticoccus litoralis]MDP1519593.1 oxidative damage protection protein [Porticoccus litoralis]